MTDVVGNVVSDAGSFSGNRADLTQDDAKTYAVPLTAMRKKGDISSMLGIGSGVDPDLGVLDNTHGTASPTLETDDRASQGSGSFAARFQFAVPAEYVDGETVTLRINCGMEDNAADTSATVDAVVVRQAAPSTDICATAAQSCNSTSAANKDFTITPTNVVVGDVLDVVVTMTVNDAASVVPVIGQIHRVELLLDVKG